MSTGKVFCSELQKLIAPVVGASARADENAVFPQLFPLRFFFYLFIGKNALLSKNGTAAENGRMRSYRMSGKDDCGIVVVALPRVSSIGCYRVGFFVLIFVAVVVATVE